MLVGVDSCIRRRREEILRRLWLVFRMLWGYVSLWRVRLVGCRRRVVVAFCRR